MTVSSAIKNVGELASPYFLLEVWARRADIDIDPETFATLRRRTRSLVRDARVAESRGEEPDAEWQARRRELLDLPTSEPLRGDPPFEQLSVRDETARDCLLVGDAPGAPDPDERRADEVDPLSTRFELALEDHPGTAEWGLLLAGLELRLYRRSTGISQQYLACRLDELVELDDEPSWKAFAALFRRPAFVPDAEGVPLVRRVVDESRRHATRLADDMRADVVDAAEAVIQGILDHPDNAVLLGQRGRPVLEQLFEDTLFLLYRVLFVLYAEARDVLPLSGSGPYRDTYSLDHLVELARREPTDTPGTYYDRCLGQLFRLLWEGPPDATGPLGFAPVGGELFDPDHTTLVDRCTIPDPAWRRALTSIAIGAAGSARARLGQRSSFAELGVDQLGSIYEGLLVLEPHLVRHEMLLVRLDGDRRVVEPDRLGAMTAKVDRHLGPGDFVLESASGRRKGSGSFYTPAEITEYLAHAAIDPLVEPILAEAASDPRAARSAVLDLRVCDPAMGSGAFLVQAARVLALAAARASVAAGDGRVTPEQVLRAKREVVRRCLYGVDLNPLAVVLAKVSLWLETLEAGRPLSFLDAHLKCGDSLVGVDLRVGPDGSVSADELATWPAAATKGLVTYLRKEAGEAGAMVLEHLGRRPSKASAGQQLSLDVLAVEDALGRMAAEREALICGGPECDTLQLELEVATAFDRLEHDEASARNRLRRAADFWCAQWFWDGEDGLTDGPGPVSPPGPTDYAQAVAALLAGEERGGSRPVLDAAEVVAQRRRFLHWALEFPEVVVERSGFDAVIGNPPWNTLSPDVKEFFATYDPSTFRRGVPKGTQSARQAELRCDPDIDALWRRESRFLYELSSYARPESERFSWFAPDGQLRKGDANVYRLFVERAYRLLRPGGRLAQVLPDSVYVSSPATGVRQHLLTDGVLERLWVFENRQGIFPIHRSVKVVLLTACRGGGPTERFAAAFRVGKDAAGRDRAVSLDELPAALAGLDRDAPILSVDQIRALAPATWSFPELQTALDAEIATHCANVVPPLNLDDRGWGLTYCRELDADKDAWRFQDAEFLHARGAERVGLRWVEPDGTEWWPLVEGTLFYHLEFPMEGKEPTKWVNGREVAAIEARQNADGRSVTTYYRVAWRDVASATNERSAIAAVLPPRTAAKDTSLTVWGGSQAPEAVVALVSLMSSFVVDYLLRFGGKTHLKYSAVDPIPAPPFVSLVAPALQVICRHDPFWELWNLLRSGEHRPELDVWQIGERRADIDTSVALAYGLSLEQFCAVLSTFPNVDRSQPMLPGEPKSFVTRDLALLAYCRRTNQEPADVAELLTAVGVDLPEPRTDLRRLDARVEHARALGAVPYRPTPRGGRTPTDPELVGAVTELLVSAGQTATELAEALDEEEKLVAAVLKSLVGAGEAFAEGRGKNRRFYVIGD
ncbi:MAG: N-6 DNA methylase [Acidimicrobiales bacterium]